MVKVLDRYVFTETFKYFVLSLLTFLVLFVIIDFVSNVDTFSKVGLKEGLTYVFARVPLYASRIVPIAMLVSTMVTLSTFSSTSELIAVKSLGISIYRFSVPILVLSVMVSLFSLFLQEFAIPKSMKLAKDIECKLKVNSKVKIHATLSSVWFKDNDKFVYMESFNPYTKEAERISIFVLPKTFEPKKRIDALKGKNVKEKEWILEDCIVRDLKKMTFKKVKEKTLSLGVGVKEIKYSQPEPETMELLKLYVVAKQMAKLGYNVSNMLVDLYSRLSLSLLPIVVAVIGIPLGMYNPRNKRGYTVVIAALLIVSMWITISFFLSLGKSGVLPPFYAAFAPVLLFFSVGLILLARAET
ncbi:lipopolysaccharide export system permease protein [Desulfurobacterium pacificum]|uniref:Lipopolysaccharide export system permease protein n=1 Tax=Desulfurobacterium pacificum TaxID=240166 RepID=A0ABY1NDU9_9BACT|nr:LptF/LptG family permease [Desulfurobacterium pacificum]SMP07168.1 lipopolysaccharide export system permease protein [Desulfurobacterium pacificum]